MTYMHTSIHLNCTFKQMLCVCTLLKWVCFIPFTVSQRAAVFVPHMVSLLGPKPQAGRTKCQLTLNAVTFLVQLCCYFFWCLSINKNESLSLPSEQWLVFVLAAKIGSVKENKPEIKLKIQLVWQEKQHRHAPYVICFKIVSECLCWAMEAFLWCSVLWIQIQIISANAWKVKICRDPTKT